MFHLKMTISGLLKTHLHCSFQGTVGGIPVNAKTLNGDSEGWGQTWATLMDGLQVA